MDFIDEIRLISEQVSKIKDRIQTEEATKTAFVMPLLQILGYNIFNPMEVCPEFSADLPGLSADLPGLKGEKVDYAILKDNKPTILIECKWCCDELGHPKHGSQLYRYFSVTEVKFGVLTNGIIYRFYTDLDKPNIMDSKPFFEFNMLDVQDSTVTELKKFSKTSFNPDELKLAASELMYTKEIKQLMTEQLVNPSHEFVKFFASQVYTGTLRQAVMDKFMVITKRSLNQFINERINDRLKTVLSVEDVASNNGKAPEAVKIAQNETVSDTTNDEVVVTTEEELEGFFIIKTILKEVIDSSRIKYKDTKNYFGIHLDGSTWKTVCRLRFNSKNKYICLLDEEKNETKHLISALDDIYSFASEIKATAGCLNKS